MTVYEPQVNTGVPFQQKTTSNSFLVGGLWLGGTWQSQAGLAESGGVWRSQAKSGEVRRIQANPGESRRSS